MGKLNSMSRKVWTGASLVVIIIAIAWGFSILGSPRTQQLYKYDEQKVNDLTNINSAVQNYYSLHNGVLPKDFVELNTLNYGMNQVDSQTQKPYEYQKTGTTTYNLCADFNKASLDATQPNIYARPIGYPSWTHPAGHYCFSETINPNMYPNPKVVPAL